MANPFWPSLGAALAVGVVFLVFTRFGFSKYGSVGASSWRFATWWGAGAAVVVFVMSVFVKFKSSK